MIVPLLLVLLAYLLCGSLLRLVFWAWAIVVTVPFLPLFAVALGWEFAKGQAVRFFDYATGYAPTATRGE